MVNQRVLLAVKEAAEFLCDRLAHDGWKKWSWNYLREHARCRTGASFTNSDSPELYKALQRAYPELAKRIKKFDNDDGGQGGLF